MLENVTDARTPRRFRSLCPNACTHDDAYRHVRIAAKERRRPVSAAYFHPIALTRGYFAADGLEKRLDHPRKTQRMTLRWSLVMLFRVFYISAGYEANYIFANCTRKLSRDIKKTHKTPRLVYMSKFASHRTTYTRYFGV